jgi:hypothetical protein
MAISSTNGYHSVASISLVDQDGANGFWIEGYTVDSLRGSFVSGAGGINGDGIADVIVSTSSTRYIKESGSSETIVIFGEGDNSFDAVNVAVLDGTDGFLFEGRQGTTKYISQALGDINGDGFDYIGVSNGRWFSNLSFADFGTSDAGGETGFAVTCWLFTNFSRETLSGAGDLDGDGIDGFLLTSGGFGYTHLGSGLAKTHTKARPQQASPSP